MVDPVETSSGHTFERSSIEKWFADGNNLCPLTMIPLGTSILRPNKTLRQSIEEWKYRNTMITIASMKPKLLVGQDEENYIPILIELIGAKSRDIRNHALVILCILAKDSDEAKERVANVDNAIESIVRSLGQRIAERKLAVALLLELSKSEIVQDCIGKKLSSIFCLSSHQSPAANFVLPSSPGPAGSSAVESLAFDYIETFLFERKPDSSKPCSDAIPFCMLDEFSISSELIDRKVTHTNIIDQRLISDPNTNMMLLIYAVVVLMTSLGSRSEQLSTKECEDLGFTGLAICSDCNTFADYAKNQVIIILLYLHTLSLFLVLSRISVPVCEIEGFAKRSRGR
ncbi:hypothetical protein TEA_022012 [Camellia sinensis var. sinensis]|uniref:RING-type E3 ubiquitin transferase n=1 Tax=Camellia sinensis var. sinensis TaxID=542762 RepID=A0A4S4EDP8_CAMSN|nr:hypothetical protein TEA_022012 [Camellia sinensis var. sinensis]